MRKHIIRRKSGTEVILFTVWEIANTLQVFASSEYEDGGITYYLHMDEDGVLQPTRRDEVICFTARADYDLSPDAEMEEVYEHEELDDPDFMNVVYDLKEQVNSYLEKIRDEDIADLRGILKGQGKTIYEVYAIGGDMDGVTIGLFETLNEAIDFARDHDERFPLGCGINDPDGNVVIDW